EQLENMVVKTDHRRTVPALRVVHLAGGLRAVDIDGEKVSIEVGPKYRLAHFPRPEYPALYATLQQIGFRTIGADFFTNHRFVENTPPDWNAFRMGDGFYAMDAENAWSNVRHAANQS